MSTAKSITILAGSSGDTGGSSSHWETCEVMARGRVANPTAQVLTL